MVKDKLIEALTISGLYSMLYNVYNILHNIENKGLQPDFELGVKEVMQAIDRLKNGCDKYLEDFVINYKGADNIKQLKCKNCGCEIKQHSKHIEYNNLYFCDKDCFNLYMNGRLYV